MNSPGNVLILGATSEIAQAVAQTFASHGHDLVLAARSPDRLEPLASDLRIRFKVEVILWEFDAQDSSNHRQWIDSLPYLPVVSVSAFGHLPDQVKAQNNWHETANTIQVNFTGTVSILQAIAQQYESRKSGSIIAISSVAGERGRQSNYLYGGAKAGLTTYLSGLRNRLTRIGVHVMTVKPGFVDTKMLAGKKPSALLTATPSALAKAIYRAWLRRKNVLYYKPIWRWIMWIIRMIPEPIFKRMRL